MRNYIHIMRYFKRAVAKYVSLVERIERRAGVLLQPNGTFEL